MAQAEERRNEADNMQMVGLLGERGNAEGIIEPMDPPEDHSNIETPNYYAKKRNYVHQLIDVALVTANLSQLYALLTTGAKNTFYITIYVFIVLSLCLQVTFALCMLVILCIEKMYIVRKPNPTAEVIEQNRRRRRIQDIIDMVCNFVVLGIVLSNLFIGCFGVALHVGATNGTQMVATTLQP